MWGDFVVIIWFNFDSYYCNGEDSQNIPYETWSSSKIFAMANAAGKSRSTCSNSGLASTTTGFLLWYF